MFKYDHLIALCLRLKHWECGSPSVYEIARMLLPGVSWVEGMGTLISLVDLQALSFSPFLFLLYSDVESQEKFSMFRIPCFVSHILILILNLFFLIFTPLFALPFSKVSLCIPHSATYTFIHTLSVSHFLFLSHTHIHRHIYISMIRI